MGFEAPERKKGDLILAGEWNAAMVEIKRLGSVVTDLQKDGGAAGKDGKGQTGKDGKDGKTGKGEDAGSSEEDLKKQIEELKKQVEELQKATKKVAFSGHLYKHTSEGGPTGPLTYDKETFCNEGGGWDGTTFTAPEDGPYFFMVSFMKDAYESYGSGTKNDVYVDILVNGTKKVNAWSGEAAISRSPGVASVIVPLKKGDKVTTRANSDAGRKRVIFTVYFAGHRV